MVFRLYLCTLFPLLITAQNCLGVASPSTLVDSAIFLSSNGQISRISASTPGNGYRPSDGVAAFLPSDANSTCPNGCLYDLLTYSSPTNDSVLHVRGKPFPLIVPYGYRHVSERVGLACGRHEKFCGAAVPVYRHYKITANGRVVHAYSYALTSLPGSIREFFPICYGWPQQAGMAGITTAIPRTTPGRPKRSGGNSSTATTAPRPLRTTVDDRGNVVSPAVRTGK